MYGFSVGGGGGGSGAGTGASAAGGFRLQPGYETRRGGDGAQEELFVEGDLFGGTTKRGNFPSAEQAQGQDPRTPYTEGPFNSLRGGDALGLHDQHPEARPSPFTRRSLQTPGLQSSVADDAHRSSAGGSMLRGEIGLAVEAGWRAWGSNVKPTGAMVLSDANGHGRGQPIAMDEDEDDMPTVSLSSMAQDEGNIASQYGNTSGGLRQRRGADTGVGSRGERIGLRADESPQRETWVLVWGVPDGKESDVLTCFLKFGHVEEQRAVPDTNWLYLKYTTRLQADKAVAAGHGSRLSHGVMLGVQRIVDDQVWRALRDGRIAPLNASSPLLARAAPSLAPEIERSHRTASGGVDDAGLLGAPPQRPRDEKNICSRIMAFFGFY